jgi:hypothetical protein
VASIGHNVFKKGNIFQKKEKGDVKNKT